MTVIVVTLGVLLGLTVGAGIGIAWEHQRGTVRLRRRYQKLVDVAAESGWTDMVLAASADVGWARFARKHDIR